jgi:hypothetical protein
MWKKKSCSFPGKKRCMHFPNTAFGSRYSGSEFGIGIDGFEYRCLGAMELGIGNWLQYQPAIHQCKSPPTQYRANPICIRWNCSPMRHSCLSSRIPQPSSAAPDLPPSASRVAPVLPPSLGEINSIPRPSISTSKRSLNHMVSIPVQGSNNFHERTWFSQDKSTK